VDKSRGPAWLDDARWYYSWIEEGSAQPVSVFDATDRDEVTSESPGTLYLRLEPGWRYSPRLRVLGAGGQEEGMIDRAGLVPGVRYAMRRDGQLVWMFDTPRNRAALQRAAISADDSARPRRPLSRRPP
jgi:hypothetical protein